MDVQLSLGTDAVLATGKAIDQPASGGCIDSHSSVIAALLRALQCVGGHLCFGGGIVHHRCCSQAGATATLVPTVAGQPLGGMMGGVCCG